MSFGKDDSQLDNMSAFGRPTFGQQAAAVDRRGGRSKSGRMPYWMGNFDLSENPAQPDTFRIVEGQYEQTQAGDDGNLHKDRYPYVVVIEHFHGATKRGAICSGGPYYRDSKRAEPCEGCRMYWEDWRERRDKKARGDSSKGPNRMSMTDKFGFTVFSYAYHFEMPQVGGDGQFRMNPKTNQPYTDWVKALNPQDPIYAGRKWKQGHVTPWLIGKTWKDTLVGWSVTVGLSCSTCGGRNSVVSRGWYCGNPNCRQLIFDPNNTTMVQQQQDEVTKKVHNCPHCGVSAYPHEEVWCHSCASANNGDGSQGKRATIFDVDLTGYRQRSGDGNQTHLIITSTSDPRPIQIADPEVLKTIKPLDLLKRYAPNSVEEQRKMWNISAHNPQAAPNSPPPQAQWAPPPGQASGGYPPPQPPPQQVGHQPAPGGYQAPPTVSVGFPAYQPAVPPPPTVGFPAYPASATPPYSGPAAYQPPQIPNAQQSLDPADISAQLEALQRMNR